MSRVVRGLPFFVFAVAAWAAPQQITISASNKGVGTFPSSAPYTTLSTWRTDWRATVTSANTAAWNSYNQVAWLIGGNISSGAQYFARLYTTGSGYTYLINDYSDTPSNVQFACPALSFSTDIVVRVQKLSTYLTCETWNVNGSNYQITQSSALVLGSGGLRGNIQIGDAASNEGTMAFFRGYSTTVPANSKAPSGTIGGDLWDYEFGGNLNDSSGHRVSLSGTGTFSYSTAATYIPACVLPPQMTLRAGFPVTLSAANSFPLDGGRTLTYVWQQMPGNVTTVAPSTLSWNSQTNSVVTISGLIAGSYTIQLTVTDGSNQSNSCSIKYGAVATDDNGTVIISNPIHAGILGPITAIYTSPWAAEPQQHIAYGQSIIQKMSPTSTTPNFWFVDYWNQALPGTITVTNGSQSITGVGTSFTTQFCQGPANPNVPKNVNSTSIAVWYPILNPGGIYPSFNGGTGRRFGTVTACADDTHLTASFPTNNGTNSWQTDAYIGAGSGLQYAYVETQCANVGGPSNCVGVWAYTSAPADFYDNVKSLYALWYRTGIDDYLNAARVLADRWWTFPSIDKGLTYEATNSSGSPWGNIIAPNRQLALTGLFMRNADSPPYDYGPGLRAIANYLNGNGTPTGSLTLPCAVGPTITTCGQDVRESGYALKFVAEDYLYNSGPSGASPNTTQASIDLASVSRDMTNRWGICQSTTAPFYYPNGICTQNDYLYNGGLYASWNGAGFAVSVSATGLVTAQSGTFNSSSFSSPVATGTATSAGTNVITVSGLTGLIGNGQWVIMAGVPYGTTVTNVSGSAITLSMNAGSGNVPVSFLAAPLTAIWFTSTGTSAPAYPNQGDPVWFYAIQTSSTTLQLVASDGVTHVSYTGKQSTASTTLGFQSMTYAQATGENAAPGFFWQPYMTGILATAYWEVGQAIAVSDPTNAANAATWSANNVANLASIGMNYTTQSGFPTNGPYYSIGLTCPGAGTGAAYPAPTVCDTGLFADRELNSELLNIATIAAQFNPGNTTALTIGDLMAAAMFAQPGELGFSGTNILGDLINPGFLYTTSSQHKWLGAFWGQGNDEAWPAARQGGLRPAILRVVQVSLDFQTATQAVLTVIRPDGTSSQTTCTSSPCPVTIDGRQGDHLLSIKYLNAVNQVLLPAGQIVIKAK